MEHLKYFALIGCSILLGGLAAIVDDKIGEGKRKNGEKSDWKINFFKRKGGK